MSKPIIREVTILEKYVCFPPPPPRTGSVGTGACDQRAFQKELIDAIKKKSEYADKVCEMTDSLKAKEAELALRNSR